MDTIFSLSTSWHYKRFDNGRDLIDKTLDMGFNYLELNFQIRQKMFNEISREAKAGRINISGLHNICPVTAGMEKIRGFMNFFNLSAADDDVRSESVKLSEMTLRNASNLDAGYVVFHLGDVGNNTLQPEEKEFRKGFKKSHEPLGTFRDFFDELIEKRENEKRVYTDNIRRSLDYLVPAAEILNVKIGIENRYYVSQIPDFDEIRFFLSEYNCDYVGFWYDFGHAANISNLGYWNYLDYLKAYKDRLIGIHIHDCAGIDDHQPPGDGNIDFPAIKELLPDNIPYVLEMSPSQTDEDIRRGVEYLRNIKFI